MVNIMELCERFYSGMELCQNILDKEKAERREEYLASEGVIARVNSFITEKFANWAVGRTITTIDEKGVEQKIPLTVTHLHKYFSKEILKSGEIFQRCITIVNHSMHSGDISIKQSLAIIDKLTDKLELSHYHIRDETLAQCYIFEDDSHEFRQKFGTLAFGKAIERWQQSVDSWKAKGWITEEMHLELTSECHAFISQLEKESAIATKQPTDTGELTSKKTSKKLKRKAWVANNNQTLKRLPKKLSPLKTPPKFSRESPPVAPLPRTQSMTKQADSLTPKHPARRTASFPSGRPACAQRKLSSSHQMTSEGASPKGVSDI